MSSFVHFVYKLVFVGAVYNTILRGLTTLFKTFLNNNVIILGMLKLFLLTLHLTHAGNILFFSPSGGSHHFLLVEIANTLATEHNVTFINQVADTNTERFDARIKLVTPQGEGLSWANHGQLEEVVGGIMNRWGDTEDSTLMHIDFLDLDEEGHAALNNYVMIRYKYFTSTEYLELVKAGGFDVIVVDDSNIYPVFIEANLQIHHLKIPFVQVTAAVEHMDPKHKQNYPYLYNSEPSMMNPSIVHTALTFSQRVEALVSLCSIFYELSGYLFWLHAQLPQYGLSTLDDLNSRIHLHLINDHPALSFPHLDPPNILNIGCFHCTPAKELPADLTSFIQSSEMPVVYVSFGSYCRSDIVPWFKDFLSLLETLDIKVVLKVLEGDKLKLNDLSDKFLVKSWVAQKDLLGSGKVKIFISHCGNNGRLESVYYKVPILCVPLFGDQYMNALLSERRNFGRTVLKEKMFGKEGGLVEALTEMLDNSTFYQNKVDVASDIIQSEPAGGKEKILYFFRLLTKNGNLDFLKNDVIGDQGMIEMHNLDIVCGVIVLVLLVILTVLYVTVKCCCMIKKRVLGKTKTE